MGTLAGTRGEVCRGAKFRVTYFFAPLPLHVSELAGASLSLSKFLPSRSKSSHEAVADWPAGSAPHCVEPANWWLCRLGLLPSLSLVGLEVSEVEGLEGASLYKAKPAGTVLFLLSRSAMRT